MGEYYFIYQLSNKYKLRVFFFSLFAVLIIVALAIAANALFFAASSTPALTSLWLLIKNEIGTFNPIGLFYAGFFGGSIFVPMPLELFFWLGLKKGNSFLFSFLMINAGIYTAQIVNYTIGVKLSKFIFNFISLKVYAMRRKLNKYGAYGIFFGNLIPFIPSELITFGLGLAKYNVYRLFLFTILGLAIKYGVIILTYRLLF